MPETKVATLTSKTPQELIAHAIASGADLTQLEKLMSLQERWEANEARKAYHEAMAAFKANPPKIKKDKKVGYDSQKGGKVGYSHASLGNVTESINSRLSEHGLSAGWTVNQRGVEISVTTKITHKQGHSEETTLVATADNSGNKNPIQMIGSTITYLERYGLLALTGLATFDQDDDGRAVVSEVVEFIDDKQKSQLIDLIEDRAVNLKGFCSWLGIESLDKMPKSKFKQAVAAIEAKKKPEAK